MYKRNHRPVYGFVLLRRTIDHTKSFISQERKLRCPGFLCVQKQCVQSVDCVSKNAVHWPSIYRVNQSHAKLPTSTSTAFAWKENAKVGAGGLGAVTEKRSLTSHLVLLHPTICTHLFGECYKSGLAIYSDLTVILGGTGLETYWDLDGTIITGMCTVRAP